MKEIIYKKLLHCVFIFGILLRFSNATCYQTESGSVLKELRNLMKIYNIDAYIVNMADAHQSEYVGESDNKIKFLTNFTGSAGEVVITENQAVFWTDSRYHQQADNQIDINCWKIMKTGLPDVPSVQKWLIDNLKKNNSRVGVDPMYISSNKFLSYSFSLNASNHELVRIETNLIDSIWINKPHAPNGEIFSLPMVFAGKEVSEKLKIVRAALEKNKADFIVIPTLDNIAWLLNLRGSDIENTPVFFSYLILSKTELHLFINKTRITPSIREHLNTISLKLENYEDVFEELSNMVNQTEGKVIVESPVSQAIVQLIPQNRIIIDNTVSRIKSVKNSQEVENMEKAHIIDGLALIRYFHWLDVNIDNQNITEYSGGEKLAQFRSEGDHYVGPSFDVISAFGANAAMAHYSAEKQTAKQITRDEMYLIDSGGQYYWGTTDVTRTMHFGTPTDFEMECFTRVLKGFIALATSVFPPSTPLSYFDYVARRPLWQAGFDFGHGTGHGVGSFLYVHEYPPSIDRNSMTLPLVNMFTSNEPGLYLDGKFGVRIEDVIQVVESDMKILNQDALTFKSITYAPLQTKLIKTSLLDKEEAKFVNDLNKRVIDTVGPTLLERNLTATYDWLIEYTVPIVASG